MVSRSLSWLNQPFRLVVIDENSGPVAFVREKISQPKDATVLVNPCLLCLLVETMDGNDTVWLVSKIVPKYLRNCEASLD